VFDWTSAKIENDGFSGLIPFEIFSLDDTLNGFDFAEIKAYLYYYGPKDPSNTDMVEKLTIKAVSTALPLNETLLEKSPPHNYGKAFSMPDVNEEDEYTKEEIPGAASERNELQNLDDIFKLHPRPKDLNLDYAADFGAGGVTITNGDGNSLIKADLLIVVPLILTAGPDGGEIKFPDMFGNEDLFGRKNAKDESTLDMLGSLKLSITLNDDLFNGADLYIVDKLPEDPGYIQPFPVSGKALSIDLDKTAMKTVKNYLLIPNIRLGFKKDHELNIPKDLGATNISFSADLDYTI
jgi:hypothetical protein